MAFAILLWPTLSASGDEALSIIITRLSLANIELGPNTKINFGRSEHANLVNRRQRIRLNFIPEVQI